MKNSLKQIVRTLAGTFTGTLALIALSACAPSVNTYENADAGTTAKQLVNDRRIKTDAGTNDIAAPIEIRTGTTPDGKNIKIQLEVMNRTRSAGRVSYLIEWFDAAGMKIDIAAAWKPITIPAGKIESISAIAPSEKAKDFRISITRLD